jgi:hypothetical protein
MSSKQKAKNKGAGGPGKGKRTQKDGKQDKEEEQAAEPSKSQAAAPSDPSNGSRRDGSTLQAATTSAAAGQFSQHPLPPAHVSPPLPRHAKFAVEDSSSKQFLSPAPDTLLLNKQVMSSGAPTYHPSTVNVQIESYVPSSSLRRSSTVSQSGSRLRFWAPDSPNFRFFVLALATIVPMGGHVIKYSLSSLVRKMEKRILIRIENVRLLPAEFACPPSPPFLLSAQQPEMLEDKEFNLTHAKLGLFQSALSIPNLFMPILGGLFLDRQGTTDERFESTLFARVASCSFQNHS